MDFPNQALLPNAQAAGIVVYNKNGNGKMAAKWQNTFYWKTRQKCAEYFKKWSLFQSVHDNFMVVSVVGCTICWNQIANLKLTTFSQINVYSFQRIKSFTPVENKQTKANTIPCVVIQKNLRFQFSR